MLKHAGTAKPRCPVTNLTCFIVRLELLAMALQIQTCSATSSTKVVHFVGKGRRKLREGSENALRRLQALWILPLKTYLHFAFASKRNSSTGSPQGSYQKTQLYSLHFSPHAAAGCYRRCTKRVTPQKLVTAQSSAIASTRRRSLGCQSPIAIEHHDRGSKL